MATPPIIDERAREDIRRVKKNAEDNIIPLEDLLSRKPLGGDSIFRVHIPVNFEVMYTHENQPGGVICRHLSMSYKKLGQFLKPIAIRMVAREFEFVNRIFDFNSQPNIGIPGHIMWWYERFHSGLITVQMIEPLNGDYEQLRK